jgi:4-hydroxythreonine-4-phosphate dehydrogenase
MTPVSSTPLTESAATPAMPRPLLITQGDVCGIGPEIIVKAFAAGELADTVVVGCPRVLGRAARACGLWLPLARLDSPLDWRAVPPNTLPVCVPDGLPRGLDDLPWGQIRAEAGAAAALCIRSAVQWIQAGAAAGMVTAPIHKEALHAAGEDVPGHTEMLQALAAQPGQPAPPVRMMLANPQLRVVLVTIHIALRQAIEALDVAGIVETLRITHEAGQRFGLTAPRIAVAGLNPHAGEGGLFGDEELRIIGPAIDQARALGIDAQGPFAPDTVFMRARHAPPTHPGAFDFVVAMTHDHGLIPVKYLGVDDGVNVTLGLPWVRTSPDHGTAFDVAGTGQADAGSLVAAWRMARQLVAGL